MSVGDVPENRGQLIDTSYEAAQLFILTGRKLKLTELPILEYIQKINHGTNGPGLSDSARPDISLSV